ncbi:portal protein [Cohnella sp. 56]|uniref:portal protein n=1 Tax=Cohnella sp. 56 TaxID=3113722 RepID=UPI0030EA4FA6
MADKITEEMEYHQIEDEFKAADSALAQTHAEWREYDAYYMADQWAKQRASWRPDPVVNYASYIVDQKRPQLTNSRPTGILLPTAQGDEDAAKLFTQVTDVIGERVDLDSRTEEVVQAGLLLDIGWFKVYWDQSLKGGQPGKGNVWRGDVAVEAPDPANIYFDPQAATVEECRYIIYAVPKTVAWIKDKFGKEVEADSSGRFSTDIYDRPYVDRKDSVMLFERWAKEDGKLNVTYAAGGKILKKIKDIYKHGRYPFVPFVAKKRRKSILGISEIRNIMSNQKLLNKLVEMPSTAALLTANPIALIDPMSGIDKNKWISKPGMTWYAKDPQKSVHWLQPPSFPGDVYKLADMLQGYIERIGGVYDALTGETPSGVTAAAAIQLLQEQGSIPIKGIARNLYASITEVYKQMVELVKQFYNETRYIRITGEDGGYEFIEFEAAKYADVDFDIKVSAGAGTPTSEAFIAQLGEELFSKGLLLGSEYVDMQKNLPNKDRIVARLREQEAIPAPAAQPQTGGTPPGAMPAQAQPAMPAAAPLGLPEQPTLDDIYAASPPEIQQQIDLMAGQGMSEQQILEQLMQMVKR